MDPSKIEWDLTNGPRSVSCDRAIRYSGFRGPFQWVLLKISWNGLLMVVGLGKVDGL